jgi:hypothetical protein
LELMELWEENNKQKLPAFWRLGFVW